MARVIVIPARLSSSRLPRKVLLDETGWPLIRHVYERCAGVASVDRVVVAADSDEIVQAVEGFGGEAVLTAPELPSGTDRVAAAVEALGLAGRWPVDGLPGARGETDSLIVNVQGDEPLIEANHIEQLFELLSGSSLKSETGKSENREAHVATLATARTDRDGYEDPNRVKVVRDAGGFALYFSRSPLPHDRDAGSAGMVPWLCHVGIYGFRPDALRRFTGRGPTDLEGRERLEQLRFLEMGLGIRVGVVDRAEPGIDTPEDYRRFVDALRGG